MKCCSRPVGTSSTYNIRVGRSTSVTGGFVDKSGVALTSGGGTLVLGSHDSVGYLQCTPKATVVDQLL